MGNIEWFSFKRNVSDAELDTVLREVVSELFGENLRVRTSKRWAGSWEVLVREGLVPKGGYASCFNLHREGPRKFGGKMGRGYRNWIRLTILEAVADRLGHATFSNEGGSETWKPEPLKYPTYRDYLMKVQFGHYENPTPEQQKRIAAMVEESFRFIPEPLRQIRESQNGA